MKLLLPLAFISLASGFCCCCGGDTVDMIKTKVQELAAGSTAVQVDATEPAPATTTSTDNAPTPPAEAATGVSVDGACGRFKDWGLKMPAAYKVVACANSAGTESLVAQGSGNPKDDCKVVKDWATGAGFGVTTEATMGDTSSLILEKGTDQLVIACTNMTGQSTISISITPK